MKKSDKTAIQQVGKEAERVKQMDKKQTDYEKTYEEVWKLLGPKGMKCGNEIERIAKEIHGDDILITLPMYRSCACIMKQTKEEKENGVWRIIAYHDPHWMGMEQNKETLPQFKEEVLLHGQRDRMDIFLNSYELTTYDQALSMFAVQKQFGFGEFKKEAKKDGKNA